MLWSVGITALFSKISSITSRMSLASQRSSITEAFSEKPPAVVSSQWLRDVLAITGGGLTNQDSDSSMKEFHCPTVCLLDATWQAEPGFDGYEQHYKRAHIHGAIFLDLQALCSPLPDTNLGWQIPDPGYFERFVANLGVTRDTHVVIYDSLDTCSAARAWFLFRLFGHNRVSVLDGGLRQWMRDGHQVCTGDRDGTCQSTDLCGRPTVPSPLSPHTFKVVLRSEMLRNFLEMKSIVENREAQIIDCRREFYLSEDSASAAPTGASVLAPSASSSGIPSAGHIPGATNLPFTDFLTPKGTFKREEELLQVFENAHVDLSVPAVVYCQRGMTSSMVALAAYLCGTHYMPIYPGSWDEWKTLAPPSLIAPRKKPDKA